MAQRNKGKEGNGAGTQAQTTESRNVPAQPATSSRLPTRMMEHPLGQFREEMDRLFDRFFARWPSPFEGAWPTPAEWGRDPERLWGLDLEDTGNEILVRAEAPGFEPKDFDVHLSGNTLTIRAEHKHEAEEKQEGYRYSERRYGRFQQSVPLPAAVEADKVEAHYRNGVLELRLPRTEPIQRKRIEVKT